MIKLLFCLRLLNRAFKYKFVSDKNEIDYLFEKINPGDTVIDIGAHKGGYLFWLSRAAGSAGKVIAFEPQSLLYNYLISVVSYFSSRNVEVHNLGVSSFDNTLKLFVPKGPGQTSPGATFENKEDSEEGYHVSVPVVSLDNFLKDRPNRIAFLKIDVEGHELSVFQGAVDLLTKDKPTIMFESENRHLGKSNVTEVFQFLKNLGYNGYFFHDSKKLPIDHFNPDKHQRTLNGEIAEKNNYINNFFFEP
ncbi:MAG TPA: FkbM family methyltransferase [Oligoflexia bacterium]|nr:FkbM family methyltransferase [Oligoflexia bacterium]HMP48994.1 FkbM family methyltransferase [Oligoflexia bacterium]